MYRCLECDDSFFEDHEFDNHECVTRLRITYCSSVFTDGSNCQNKAVHKWVSFDDGQGDIKGPFCQPCHDAIKKGAIKQFIKDHNYWP